MKFLSSVVAFFADDIPTAVLTIIWILAAAAVSRVADAAPYIAVIFFVGLLAILVFGVWRRAKTI